VMMMRTGDAFFSPLHLFSCGCLYFASLWWSTRRHIFFGIALALLGLGLSTMLWFGWFVAGLAVATLLLAPRTFVRLGLREGYSSLRLLAAGLVGALLGSALLLYREWTGEFDLTGKVSSDVTNGFDVYLANILVAWATLCDTWWAFSANPWFGFNPWANGFYPWAVVGAIGIVACLAWWNSEDQPRLLLPVVLVVMLAQVPLALRSVETATFFLYPLPQMVVAAAILGSWRRLPGRRAKLLALSLVLLLVGAELRSLGGAVSLLRARVAQGAHQGPVYRLSEWLRESHPNERPLFLNDSDAIEPYLYFLEPDRGLSFATTSPKELLSSLNSEPSGGATDWTFVYALPGSRPDELLPSQQEPGTQVEVVAEFSHEQFRQEFPVVVIERDDPAEEQHPFGPPVTVYRLRR
jgi:hypothetical protein